jgi:hypothetical protein
MPDVFWIGLGVLGAGLLTGLAAGARSADTSAITGAAIGGVFGLLGAFPLLAIGLSTS